MYLIAIYLHIKVMISATCTLHIQNGTKVQLLWWVKEGSSIENGNGNWEYENNIKAHPLISDALCNIPKSACQLKFDFG
jgi:hypothetical protein